MEKAKDGVTLIADAIRREMAEQAKTTVTTAQNVIDVTAQFQNATPASTPAPTPETKGDVDKTAETTANNEAENNTNEE